LTVTSPSCHVVIIATTIVSASVARVLARSLVELGPTVVAILLAVSASRKLIDVLPEPLHIPLKLWVHLVKMLISIAANSGIEEAAQDTDTTQEA